MGPILLMLGDYLVTCAWRQLGAHVYVSLQMGLWVQTSSLFITCLSLNQAHSLDWASQYLRLNSGMSLKTYPTTVPNLACIFRILRTYILFDSEIFKRLI